MEKDNEKEKLLERLLAIGEKGRAAAVMPFEEKKAVERAREEIEKETEEEMREMTEKEAREIVRLGGEIWSAEDYIVSMARNLKELEKKLKQRPEEEKELEYKKSWLMGNLRGFGDSALEFGNFKIAVEAYNAAGLLQTEEVVKKLEEIAAADPAAAVEIRKAIRAALKK